MWGWSHFINLYVYQIKHFSFVHVMCVCVGEDSLIVCHAFLFNLEHPTPLSAAPVLFTKQLIPHDVECTYGCICQHIRRVDFSVTFIEVFYSNKQMCLLAQTILFFCSIDPNPCAGFWARVHPRDDVLNI